MSVAEKSIKHVKEFTEYIALTGSSPCIVKFTASWCGPCKRLAPLFEKLSQEHESKVNFLEIDIDAASQITNYENIQSIPLILFFNEGKKNENFSIKGANGAALEENVRLFVLEVENTDLVKEEEIIDPLIEDDGDEAHNEYGQDCEIPIEKTITDDMINTT